MGEAGFVFRKVEVLLGEVCFGCLGGICRTETTDLNNSCGSAAESIRMVKNGKDGLLRENGGTSSG